MEIKDKELHRIALTTIIYNEEGKFLITKRALTKKVFPGKWTVPGGGLNVDDYIHLKPTHGDGQWYHSLESALRREVREEVGLEIDKPKYLLDLTFIRPDGIPVLVLSYFARLSSGKVTLDSDNIEYAWVTAEEAKGYDVIAGLLDEIKMVEGILKNV